MAIQPARLRLFVDQHHVRKNAVPPAQHAADALLLLRHDLAQHAAQAIAAARPLHGARVSQQFALARNSRLQQAACHPAQPAYCHDDLPGQPREHGYGQCLPWLAALPHAPKRLAVVVQHFQPGHHAGQLHVDASITLVQMAELMRNQPLQLFARQPVERAFGHDDDGIILRPAGSKGVDGYDSRLHHDLRARHMRYQRHLVHHVLQPLLGQSNAGPHFARAQQARHPLARLDIAAFNPPAAQHHEQPDAHVHLGKQARKRPTERPENGSHATIQPQHGGCRCQQKGQYQAARTAARIGLMIKKVHGLPQSECAAHQNCTRGAWRSSSLAVDCSMAPG